MSKKMFVFVVVLVVLISLILSACGTNPPANNDQSLQMTLSALQTQVVGGTPTPDLSAQIQAMQTKVAYTVQTNGVSPTMPAQPAVQQPAVQPVVPAAPASGCMTDSEVMNLFGFKPNEVIRTDAPWDVCKWTRQNLPSAISLVLKEGWGLTYTDQKGDVWVTIGKGQSVTAKGFTLRQPGNQFLALGPTGLFNKEWTFGFAPERGSNTYAHCPDANMSVTLTIEQQSICAGQMGPSGNTAPAQTPAAAPIGSPSDPTFAWNKNCFDKQWLTSNIGGDQDHWAVPDWDGGAAVYKMKNTFIPLKYPGSGKLVVWMGSGPVEITASNTAQLTGKRFDEASFHCRQ